MLKEGKKEKIIGIIILVAVVVAIIVIKNVTSVVKENTKVVDVYGAVGGGKEDFLADEEVNKILNNKYHINFVYDSWSNGKTVSAPLVREYVHKGKSDIPESSWSVNNDSCSKYDVLFTSDERFYNYYQDPPADGEAERMRVIDGDLTLNTPIVIYSWDTVVDALEKEAIVTKKDGVYYITDMPKLIDYIIQGKKWSDIGLNIYGYININSVDPVSSSPGASYYGLLLSIMSEGQVNETNIEQALPKLKEFYDKSGFMNNTPADLFQSYLKTGVGSKPMIVDYEKSIVEFKNSNPDGYASVKKKIRILYPTPTIWNSHCIAAFNDNGKKYLKAFDDKEIQQIAWAKYGFRTGQTGGNYDVSKVEIDGIPQSIDSATPGLKMNIYNRLIEYLSKGE